MLVREQATEAKAKALGEKAGLLRFAAQGELNEQDPLSSALLLVPEGQEDGRLEVREVFGLDLKARLVVLSACETGLGKLSRGDELVGLQRAFLYAGTPAVVTTLWKVDDRASFRLMEYFYATLDAAGPAAALRQAQRATMAEFPRPFAWAAFGLTGCPSDQRPVPTHRGPYPRGLRLNARAGESRKGSGGDVRLRGSANLVGSRWPFAELTLTRVRGAKGEEGGSGTAGP